MELLQKPCKGYNYPNLSIYGCRETAIPSSCASFGDSFEQLQCEGAGRYTDKWELY